MTSLEVRAEILKLARVLDRNPEHLLFLTEVPAADIRRLREAAHEHLFNGERARFRRIAAATKLLPTRVVTAVAEKAFAPVFLARIAGEMPTDRAIEIAQRMNTGLLADVTLELDPRAVGPILHGMPVAVVRAVALELVRRGEHIAMGLFVGYLSDRAIREVLAALTDEEDLLRIGLFIEARERIPTLVRMLSTQRQRRIVELAQDEAKDLWATVVALMAQVDAQTQRTLGDMVADQDDEQLTRLLHRSQDQDLWPGILPVVIRMSPDKQARLLSLDALADPEVLTRIFEDAERHDLARTLLPMIATIDVDDVVAAANAIGGEKLVRLFRAAEAANLVPRLLAIAARLDAEQRAWLMAVTVAMPAELQERFTDEVERAQLWPPLIDLAATIPPAARAGLAAAVARIAAARPELVERLAEQAEARGLTDLVSVARAATD
ncbi:hypothetical protein ACQEVB_12835 [Pseudonocardia sp. CA-107938]|uniref:hypothetical protein n=1 Tax=Pseudonocardia sp. CA-107938 TaxID=3240021 RepID=UPI003D93C1B5